MQFIRIGQRIVNLQNVKIIELIENSKGREMRFYFIDGSYSYYGVNHEEEDKEFEAVWQHFSNMQIIS